MSRIVVELAEERHELEPDRPFRFGREGDLVVDTNRYLHRRLGLFRFTRGRWVLENVGSTILLEIVDQDSASRMTLAPGSSIPLPFSKFQIRFQAGAASYELDVTSEKHKADALPDPGDSQSTTTVTAARVSLNKEQRLLLVALSEQRLRTGSLRAELPTNREIADRLQWAITKYNRKLDNLCYKFDRLGVVGVKGDLAGMATSRRHRLVDYVVTAGIVSEADLHLLEDNC